jgi:dTDP-4-amino-4,6-dideoxygalactose transaminase
MSKPIRKIPMADLVGQYKKTRKEIDSAIKAVLESGQFIMGPDVKAFEQDMSAYLGAPHAISCNSGTDALQIALMAIGLKPGDEVVTSPFTFVATAEVIALLGGKPVFADIDPSTYCIDPNRLEKAITRKTKAIIPVHLYGQAADMDAINAIAKKRGIAVIEDACQAIGATYKERKVCTLSDIACLSFFPSKNLGAYGDGGMMVTSDEKLAQAMRMIRNHGSSKRYHHEVLGVNSRLDTLQAAILRVRLNYLDSWSEARRDRAAMYTELFKDMPVVTPVIAETNTHVFHQYSIRVKNRDAVRDALTQAGVDTAIHYPIPLHLQPAFRHFGKGEGQFPISEKTAKEIFSLPMFPELKEEDIHFIVDTVQAAL